MDENAQNSQTLFPHETGHGHHRSARERQRQGPMWGCLRTITFFTIGILLVLVLIIGGGWWYLGTASFSGLVAERIAETLKARLGRDVSIGRIEIDRVHFRRAVVYDVRIANAPGAVAPYFATVKKAVITGGIESFWRRSVKLGRIDIYEPHLDFELYPAGSPLVHNFPHWNAGPPSRFEIVHVEAGTVGVSGGRFDFLDRRHQITATVNDIASKINITSARNLYAGIVTSPRVNVRIQDYVPFDLDLRGGIRYTPGRLALQSVAMRGRGMSVFVSGSVAPLDQGVYNLRVISQTDLDRVREIFRVNQTLQGVASMDARLRGRAGTFTLDGGWVAPEILADVYRFTNMKGTLNVTGDRAIADVKSAHFASGTITAHYTLAQYAEPYPMNADVHYSGVSVEDLFDAWTVRNTGLRSTATGRLVYHWNKDKILEGAGDGTAVLTKADTRSGAEYPVPAGGSVDYALDNGVVTFRRTELDTPASHVSLTGTLRISDLFTNFLMKIHSTDFAELDRIGYNFAHSAGKKTYTLLGLGGTGDVSGSINGPLKTPMVVAHMTGTGARYNNVLLGAAQIDLHYDGKTSVLTFDRAIFERAGGRMSLTGTLTFPERGPSPRFDLGVEATNFPVDAALAAMNLKLNFGGGTGTGRMIVTGDPETGKVTFITLVVHQGDSQIRVTGDIAWFPGAGNVRFNLDLAARDFPVSSIMTFLDVGTFPVKGQLTGTLHIEGPKNALEGAGSVTVRNGSIYGEPVTQAAAEITFHKGTLRATNVSLTGPAGKITGEAELNLTTNQFSYSITAANVDLSKVGALAALNNLFGGKLTITSSGAGTFNNPELVVEATLNEATLRGLALPADSPPPSLYIAIRGGRLIIRGSAANVLTIEGDGAVGQDLAVDGTVRITISDIARLLALSPNTATIPASGNITVDIRLGGKLTSLEDLTADATVPSFDLKISEHEFTPRSPIHFSLRRGRFTFDSFELQRTDSIFSISGFADLTGDKRLDIRVRGELEAALLQLFTKDVRADGHVALDLSIGGKLGTPVLTGTADLQKAQIKFAGFPQLIDNINGRLTFGTDRVTIESLRADIGGGTVVAGGFVTLNGITPNQFRVTVQTLEGTDVAIRYFEGVTVAGTFTLVLTGDLERAVLTGDVDVTRALYFKDFNLQQSLLNVVLARRGITPIVAASWQDRINLNIHMKADNSLAVRNNIASVTGTAELDLSGTLANPVVLGTVTLNEGGTVRLQNIDYTVVRGTINFQNPFRIDPYFDVTISGRVSGGISEIETGPIDVTVNITGTLDRITPTISSEPPASDITLFSILGFGALTQRSGTTAANLPGTGTSLLISSISSALASKIFPFADSFTYDPGQLDTSLGAGRKVSFEKRVSNVVRLIVVYNLDNAKAREVVEWAATRDWTLQFTNDQSANQYRLDARFRRLYEGRWSLDGHGRGEEIFPLVSITGKPSPAAARLTPPPPPTTIAPITPGTVVTDVQFRYDRPLATTNLLQYVTVKPGQPLTTRDVQNTIKSLFATGNFRDVHADETPAANGVVVTFSLYLNYRVGKITFDGLRGSERSRATRDLRVHPGDILSLNAVDNSGVAVQEDLNRNGYLEATVDPETTYLSERNIADVTFHVTEGPRAKVATVTLEGNVAPFTQQDLIRRMKEKPGAAFRLNMARSDADRMKNYVVRRDYRRAEFDFLGDTYDRATKTVALRYRANVGPIVKVEVTGISRSSIRKVLPFAKNQEYSEDTIDRAADDIVLLLQERGYVNAAADTESRMVNDVWVTTFNVRPGQRYRLTEVTFTGNQKVSDKKLQGVVQTAPTGGFRHFFASLFRRPTGVTRTQLNDDRDALESYYRLNGFSTATVAAPKIATHADGTLTVDFPITEGPQTLVSGVFIEGAEQVDPRQLPRMQLVSGQPLNPQFVRSDVLALQTFYADRGNAEAQVTPRVEVSADKTAARVTYTISEGPQIHVGDVVVRGNTYTDSNLILRKAELDKGDPFSYSALLESQRNLYRLGIFNRVEIQPDQAGTSLSERNVTVAVEEGKNLTASGSVGFLYDRALTGLTTRFAGAVAHRNLFGTGRYLGLEGVYAPNTDREAYLTYQEPFIGRWNVPVSLTVFQTDDFTRRDARIQQRGTSIEATKVAFLRTRWSVQYQYKVSICKQGELCTLVSQNIPVPTLPRSLLDIQIASVTPTFFWDRRDDIIDPHHGFFTSASVTYAFPAFSAKSNFFKEFAQGAWYLPVSERSVLVLSSRAGLIQPLGQSDQTRFVPLSERFIGGGESSDRAFPLDLLGDLCFDKSETSRGRTCVPTLINLSGPDVTNPRDFRLAPLGGNGMLIMNAEYRFPLFGPVGGAVFTDVGNVFGTSTIHFDDLRYGVGGGFRYISPVGPLRLDIGWPLERRSYERPFSYSLSLGLPF